MPQTIGEIRNIKDGIEVEWIISDFFKISEEKDIKYDSPTFHFAGVPWYFQIYPNGQTSNDTAGNVNCFLMKGDSDSVVTLAYEFGLKKLDGKIDKPCNYTERTFTKKKWGEGCFNFIPLHELLERKTDLAPSNAVTIVCRLTRNECKIVSSVSYRRLNELSDNFRKLMHNGNDSDITVRIKEKEFKLHKCVLGIRSPAFASMLQREIKESLMDIVDMYGFEETIFSMFIEYIYTGSVAGLEQKNFFGLYKIAEKYEVAELKEDCLKCIKNTLSKDTFFDAVELSENYDVEELKTLTTKFCTDNLKDLVKCSEWLTFMQENTKNAYELLSTALDNYIKI